MSTQGIDDKLNMSLDEIIKNDRIVNGADDNLDQPLIENNSNFNVSRTHSLNLYNRHPEQQNRNSQNYRYHQNHRRRFRNDHNFRNYRYNSNRPNRYSGWRNDFYRHAYQNTMNNPSSDLYHNQNWRGRNIEMPLTHQTLADFNYSSNGYNGDRMRRSQSVLSNHSFHSNYSRHSNFSRHSNRSNHSHRSNYSHMSYRSNYSNMSNRSNRSNQRGSWRRNNRSYYMRNPLDMHIQEEIKSVREGSKHKISNSPLSLEKIYNFKPTPMKTDISITDRFLSYYQL